MLHGLIKFVQIIIWKMIIDKHLRVEKDDGTVTSTREEGAQETSTLTGRPNIDVITARNEKEARQDRKSSYKIAGIVALLVVIVMIAIYFFR